MRHHGGKQDTNVLMAMTQKPPYGALPVLPLMEKFYYFTYAHHWWVLRRPNYVGVRHPRMCLLRGVEAVTGWGLGTHGAKRDHTEWN